jgi:hypothetical protein
MDRTPEKNDELIGTAFLPMYRLPSAQLLSTANCQLLIVMPWYKI